MSQPDNAPFLISAIKKSLFTASKNNPFPLLSVIKLLKISRYLLKFTIEVPKLSNEILKINGYLQRISYDVRKVSRDVLQIFSRFKKFSDDLQRISPDTE